MKKMIFAAVVAVGTYAMAADPVLKCLSENTLLLYIEGNPAHTKMLVERFRKQPKPMYYQPAFLRAAWEQYLRQTGLAEDRVDPDAFVRWTYARALAHRQPRYEAMARNWGVQVTAGEVAAVRSESGFVSLVAAALEARG